MAAALLGSRILRQAADAYDRAARSPYGHIPPPTPAGNRLRQAARLLSAFAYLTGDQSMAPIVLLSKLAALAEAVAELRESQQHAAQAAAARASAERLRTATDPTAQLRRGAPASSAARLAALSFPANRAWPSASRTEPAWHRSRRPAANTSATIVTATRPQSLAPITTTAIIPG